jgi:hypothetical protein
MLKAAGIHSGIEVESFNSLQQIMEHMAFQKEGRHFSEFVAVQKEIWSLSKIVYIGEYSTPDEVHI